MIPDWLLGRSRIEVPCTVEIERTAESLHAHALPDGIDVGPGDTVIVHEAPSQVAFGERMMVQTRATVIRGGWLDRAWAQIGGMLSLTELYEVGFQNPTETGLKPREEP